MGGSRVASLVGQSWGTHGRNTAAHTPVETKSHAVAGKQHDADHQPTGDEKSNQLLEGCLHQSSTRPLDRTDQKAFAFRLVVDTRRSLGWANDRHVKNRLDTRPNVDAEIRKFNCCQRSHSDNTTA